MSPAVQDQAPRPKDQGLGYGLRDLHVPDSRRRCRLHVLGKSSQRSPGHLSYILGDAARATLTEVALQIEHPICNRFGHALRQHPRLQVCWREGDVADGATQRLRQLVSHVVIRQRFRPAQRVNLALVTWRRERDHRDRGDVTHVHVTDRVLTFSYFIPTMVGLMNAADSSASVASATRWAQMNYLRHGLVLGGWLAALKTFSLWYLTRAHD
jgi:hypothetical protein